MITAEWKPIPELLASLKGHKNVLLVGCATCVAECAAGGEREVNSLAPILRMGLKNEGQDTNIITRTLERQCEPEFVEELAALAPQVDAIMSIACGIGMQLVAERFQEIPLYPGVNTTSLSIRELPGLWTARCGACGDCVLGETFGLCPVARCAKSLLNGPCGGTRRDGKCEVDENTDCIWYLIVERAKARGRLADLAKVRQTKNWSNSSHGGPKRMVREDLRS
ncbi:MAG: methylenetetrahydrofolate reductase C-terminal domain-containing protein [Deltaproteobacteria bacterium]|nr:methylenetetrahydrofolate reductase C-terminal domain-containing protein [Deltaproteobacteria bacterium]